MHDVFISYSTKNAAIADAICNRLEAGGIRCWYAPRDVQPGKGWAGELMRAIQKAKVFLLIYSKDYNQSKQVISELTEAVDAGCTIVPFRVDQSIMNDDLAFYLKKIHWLDAINPPTQNQIEVLYKHVARILGSTPSPPPSPLTPGPEEERRQMEEEEKRKKEEQQRKRKERRKKNLLKVVLPVVLALCLCVVGAWLGREILFASDHKPDDSIRQEKDPISSQKTEENQDSTEPEAPEETGPQTICFDSLSRLDKYGYPFCSVTMLSSDGAYILLENKESGTYTLARTDNGSVYRSGIKLPDFEDLSQIRMGMTDGYDTVYFVDHLAQTVSSYDHTKNEWINPQGTKLELKDTEYIFLTSAFTENMKEENVHKGELGILIYDTDPAVDCISKMITVRPDGTVTVNDISQAGLVNIINGVDRAGYAATLMVDKNRNLRILDDQTGVVLNLSHEDILQDYLPYVLESEAICEDNRYYLAYENNQAQVWDLHTGSRVYSRTFAQFSYVFFSDPHEIIVYNGEDQSVFTHDLETGRETVLMDKNYFEVENETVFMDDMLDFRYSREHDVCLFATANEYNEQGEGQWRIVVTDREGKILAVSEELTTYNGSHYCLVNMVNNLLLVDMTLADWDTAQPEDGIVTELFRAEFAVDEAGNLIFK